MMANEKGVEITREKLVRHLDMKKRFLEEILRLTEHTKFKDTEEDAQIFINLVEKRENIMMEIKRIDFEISSAKYRDIYENHKDEIETINDIIKDLIETIVKVDDKVSKKADIAFLEIKKRVKEYNDGQNLNDAYYGTASTVGVGNYYD